MENPTCKTCRALLVSGKNITKSRLTQGQHYCQPHWAEYKKLHRTPQPPEYFKEQHLRREYQTSRADWEALYAYQSGKCAACGRPIADFLGVGGQRAALDHDHKSGLIRGLLCIFPCNRVLGLARDNPKLCRGLADYLDNPPATSAFGAPRFTLPGQVGTKKRRKLFKKLRKSLDKPPVL